MDKKEKNKIIIALVINVTVFALGVFCLVRFIHYLMIGNTDNRFRYFTNVSNLSVAFLSLISAIYLLISLLKGKNITPFVLSLLKYLGIVMTTLTFITVVFVLAPISGFYEMYKGERFITHLIIPVVSFVSFIFLEDRILFNWKTSFLAMLPLFIYGIVYVICVVFTKSWPDIYQINKQGVWYLYAIAFLVANFGISQGIYFLKKKILNKAIY